MAESDVWQALSDTINRAVNLRIVTLVGDATVTGTLERLEVGAPSTSGGSLVTDINLVGGDITRISSDKLLGAEYADLRASHQDSVKQAQDIVERNVKILTSIIKELGDQLHQLPQPSAGPTRIASKISDSGATASPAAKPG
jgi:hypothetical protein